MIRRINLGNKKEAIKAFETLKANDYVPFDIELLNSHLKKEPIMAPIAILGSHLYFI